MKHKCHAKSTIANPSCSDIEKGAKSWVVKKGPFQGRNRVNLSFDKKSKNTRHIHNSQHLID